VQRLLGRVNDYAATRRLVSRKGAPRKLVSWLKKKQRQNIEEFRRFWSEQVTRPEPVHRRPIRTIA